jgi:hypothetical protein
MPAAESDRAPNEQGECQRADCYADRGVALGAEIGGRDGQDGDRGRDAEQPAKAPPPDEFDQASENLEGVLEQHTGVRRGADTRQVREPRPRSEVPHGCLQPGSVDAPAVRRQHIRGAVRRSVWRDESRIGGMPPERPAPGRPRLLGRVGRQRPSRRTAADRIAAAGEPDDPQVVVVPDDDVRDILPGARAGRPRRLGPGAPPDALGVGVQRGSRHQAARHDHAEPGRLTESEAAQGCADRLGRPPVPAVAGRVAPCPGMRVAHIRDITPRTMELAISTRPCCGPRGRAPARKYRCGAFRPCDWETLAASVGPVDARVRATGAVCVPAMRDQGETLMTTGSQKRAKADFASGPQVPGETERAPTRAVTVKRTREGLGP